MKTVKEAYMDDKELLRKNVDSFIKIIDDKRNHGIFSVIKYDELKESIELKD